MLSFAIDKIANNQNPVSVSSRLREKRLSKFLIYFNIDSKTTILDVGGTPHTWIGTGFEENVVLLNIVPPPKEEIYQKFRYVEGDALNMHMFGDNSFDVVFSNSVIEHVGSIENQRRFAEEVQRVGKSYWVQTPNKHFPIEPHVLFPFFQFLPGKIQKKIALRWKYSHYKKWKKDPDYILKEITNTRLLHRNELSEMFGNTGIYTEKLLGMAKSLVAYKKQRVKQQIRPVKHRRRPVKVA